MIICPYCKVRGPGRPRAGTRGGNSRVVESRRAIARSQLNGKRLVTRTMMRLRQCITCRYRWKTIEVRI